MTPGVYTIEYSFIDPKEGYTSRKVTLTVLKKEEETEKPTEKPTEGETGTGENPTTKASEESSSGTTAGAENKINIIRVEKCHFVQSGIFYAV